MEPARSRSPQSRSQQPTVVADNGRVFAAHPAAVFVFVFRDDERVLLLKQPNTAGWRPVGGAVESNETILQAAMREVAEELGAGVQVRPLGVVHAWTYRFDESVPQLIDIAWVMSYAGGDVIPGSDMAGSEWRWCSVDEVDDLQLRVPQGPRWLLERAADAYRRYRGHPLELEGTRDGRAGAA
jgi:8-oxo-dGTP pyrophosphatase MutT (NUDIX family)